ncbi:hypothetical protein KR044_003964, partial [Drosophila immigrans]
INRDLTVALCERRNGPNLYLASAYLPYEEKDPPSESIRALIQHAQKEGTDLILGCDANAHNTIWGSKDTNERGESLLEFVMLTNLNVCNRGSHPTCRNKNRADVIDLTLATNSDSLSVEDWHVSTECSFSDHYRIVFEVGWSREAKAPFRDPPKANWVKYSKLVMESISNHPVGRLDNPDKLEESTQTVIDTLCKAFIKSCPISRPPKSNRNKWWTPELGRIRKETRKLYIRAKDGNCQVDSYAYHHSFKTFKKEIRRAKRDSWSKFCEELTNTTEASRLRRLLAKDPATPGLLCNLDGTFAKNSQESLQLLMNAHFPGCTQAEDENGIPSSHISGEPEGNAPHESQVLIDEIVNTEKIIWAIKSFHPYKSAGPDDIRPVMLQMVCVHLSQWLREIFRGCLLTGYIPK